MTSFTVTTHKERIVGNELNWTNKFVVDATTFDQALDQAVIIATGEANTMWDNYRCMRVTAKSYLGGQTRVRAVDLPGARTGGDIDTQLPLFNTVRCVFTPASGRIFSHYMRFVLDEADVTGFSINSAMQTLVNDEFMTTLLEDTQVRSVNGELIVDSEVRLPIQYRQLGAHRRFRPGFHRGWVANS